MPQPARCRRPAPIPARVTIGPAALAGTTGTTTGAANENLTGAGRRPAHPTHRQACWRASTRLRARHGPVRLSRRMQLPDGCASGSGRAACPDRRRPARHPTGQVASAPPRTGGGARHDRRRDRRAVGAACRRDRRDRRADGAGDSCPAVRRPPARGTTATGAPGTGTALSDRPAPVLAPTRGARVGPSHPTCPGSGFCRASELPASSPVAGHRWSRHPSTLLPSAATGLR